MRPGWKVTERHICDESRAEAADKLLIKPTGAPRPVTTAGTTSPQNGTPQRPDHARVSPGHRPRSLAAIHPEPLQTHSQITRWPSQLTTPRTSEESNTT